MSKKVGKITKLPAEEFKEGRKLYFVPLIYSGKEAPADYIKNFDKYWEQVGEQLSDLEVKLGKITQVYHELVPVGGEEGNKVMKELSEKSYQISQVILGKGAQLEAIEEVELLTEFMDWSKCLTVGLQNHKVFTNIYESYVAVGKERCEHIARRIDETLGSGATGLFFMREGHQVQFPQDIQVFYVAPPALDEIKRWLRDREVKPQQES